MESQSQELVDPYKSLSSSNLEDLALGNSGSNNHNMGCISMDSSGIGDVDIANANAMESFVNNPEDDQIIPSSDPTDPWAVLAAAAAAGEESTMDPFASTSASTVTLAHSEGESFAMPGAAGASSSSMTTTTSAIVEQIRTSTANLIHEVDAKTGISTRARTVDDQFHISEKWSHFHNRVILPTTTKTKEIVNDKITPTVKEQWSSMQQRAAEMGVKERMINVSSAVGQTWHETSARVGHWKEEQEMKRAVANAQNESLYGDARAALASDDQHHHHHQQQFQQHLEGAKEKVVEGWNWISHQIQEAKSRQQRHQSNSSGSGGSHNIPGNRTSEMRHLDSDGLPSSFRKE